MTSSHDGVTEMGNKSLPPPPLPAPVVWPGQVLEWTCFQRSSEWGLVAGSSEEWGETLIGAGTEAE